MFMTHMRNHCLYYKYKYNMIFLEILIFQVTYLFNDISTLYGLFNAEFFFLFVLNHLFARLYDTWMS